MGQAASEESANAEERSPSPSSISPSSPFSFSSSLVSRLEEAAEYGDDDDDESVEAKALKALACPCLAELRSGPCGSQFSEAFLCYLKSTSEEKGSDCVHPFVALQNCIKANPDAFSKDVLEDNDKDREGNRTEPAQSLKIYPPLWSKDTGSPNSRL